MPALGDEMTRLFFVLNPPLEGGASCYVQFIGPSEGEGVSLIAREFALAAARHIEGHVLLLDLDATGVSQFDSLGEEPNRIRFGEIGPPIAIRESPLWSNLAGMWSYSADSQASRDTTPLATYHRVGEGNLFVSRMNHEMIARHGRPRISGSQKFWQSLGEVFQVIVIDSPPPTVGFDGLAVCKFCDATLLVVSAEHTRRPVAINLRNQILDNDGHIGGIVFNRRQMHIPAFIYRLL